MRLLARLLVVVALVAAFGVAAPTDAAAPAGAASQVDADTLRARVGEAIEVARQSVAQPSAERMEALRAIIGLPASVTRGSWSIDVAADPVLEALDGTTAADFERATARLQVLERALDEALAREVPDPARIDAALAGAFRGIPQAQPGLWDQALLFVGSLIGSILARASTTLGSVGGLIAIFVVLAVAVAVLLFLGRQLRLVPDRRLPLGNDIRRAAPTDWMAKADEALHAGDVREAVRLMYLALVATLAQRGWLADAPALTAGEARAAVERHRPAVSPAIGAATERYERVIYGETAVDPLDVDALRDAVMLAGGR